MTWSYVPVSFITFIYSLQNDEAEYEEQDVCEAVEVNQLPLYEFTFLYLYKKGNKHTTYWQSGKDFFFQ